MADLTEDEETVNRAIKQTLSHHIKTAMKNVDIHTSIDELKKFYYELIDFAKSKFTRMSENNMYHLNCHVISGLSMSPDICRKLMSALNLQLDETDLPCLTHVKTPTITTQTHTFRATFGIKMPYFGGGSVIFRVPSGSSST
jgi:hypothetical protein